MTHPPGSGSFDGDGAGVYGYLHSRPETFEQTVAVAEMLSTNLRFSD